MTRPSSKDEPGSDADRGDDRAPELDRAMDLGMNKETRANTVEVDVMAVRAIAAAARGREETQRAKPDEEREEPRRPQGQRALLAIASLSLAVLLFIAWRVTVGPPGSLPAAPSGAAIQPAPPGNSPGTSAVNGTSEPRAPEQSTIPTAAPVSPSPAVTDAAAGGRSPSPGVGPVAAASAVAGLGPSAATSKAAPPVVPAAAPGTTAADTPLPLHFLPDKPARGAKPSPAGQSIAPMNE